MKFNPDHKVILDSLSEEEAQAFIKFLGSEIVRHFDDIFQARELIGYIEKEILKKEK